MSLENTIIHSADRPLSLLDPILSTWHDAIARYGMLWRWRDVPYWYNERASVSTFAAAIWLAGGVALEEYKTDKEVAEDIDISTGRSPRGRGDLYFHYSDFHFIAEAKQHWAYPADSIEKTIQETQSQLKRACADVRVKRAYDDPAGVSQRRLGLVFAVPCLPKKARDNWEAQTDSWLQCVVKSVSADCITWYSVPEERIPTDKKGQLYPGVCLLICQANERQY